MAGSYPHGTSRGSRRLESCALANLPRVADAFVSAVVARLDPREVDRTAAVRERWLLGEEPAGDVLARGVQHGQGQRYAEHMRQTGREVAREPGDVRLSQRRWDQGDDATADEVLRLNRPG